MPFIPLMFASEKDLPPNLPPSSRVPWPFAIACCVYYLLAYLALATATPTFAQLLDGLAVEIPLPTRLLIATYWWICPVLFVGAAGLTILKQLVPLHGLRLRVANISLIFVGVVFVPLAILSYYLPLFVLIHKLHSVK